MDSISIFLAGTITEPDGASAAHSKQNPLILSRLFFTSSLHRAGTGLPSGPIRLIYPWGASTTIVSVQVLSLGGFTTTAPGGPPVRFLA